MKGKYNKTVITDMFLKSMIIVAAICSVGGIIIIANWKNLFGTELNIANGIAIEMYLTSILFVALTLFWWRKPIQSDEQNNICTVFSIMWLMIPIAIIFEILLRKNAKFDAAGSSYEKWIYFVPIMAVVSVLIYKYFFKKSAKLKQISNCAFTFCGTYIFLINFYFYVFNDNNDLLDTAGAFVAFSLVIISGTKVWNFWRDNEEIKLFGKSATIVKQNIYKVERSVPEIVFLKNKWIRFVFWMRMPLVLKTIDCDYDENDKRANKKLYTDWVIAHEGSFKKICDDNKCTIYNLAECLWNINSSLTIKNETRGKNDDALRISKKMKHVSYGKINISVKELIGVLYEEAEIELDEKEKIVTPWRKLIEK